MYNVYAGCPKKTPFKDFSDLLDDILKTFFLIIQLVVYLRHLKNKLAF